MLGSRAHGFTLIVLVAACGGRTALSGADDSPVAQPSAPQAGTSSRPGMGLQTGGVANVGSAGTGGGAVATGGAAQAGSGGTGACGDQTLPDLPLPRNLTGEYEVVTCGTWTPCDPKNSQIAVPLPSVTHLSVTQDPADPSRGTVMLNGTGELLVDNRVFDAEFKGKSFQVVLDGPLSPSCSQRYAISLLYDFEGVGPRSLTLDFERSPKCMGNDGHFCTGNVRGAFGNAHPVGDRR